MSCGQIFAVFLLAACCWVSLVSCRDDVEMSGANPIDMDFLKQVVNKANQLITQRGTAYEGLDEVSFFELFFDLELTGGRFGELNTIVLRSENDQYWNGTTDSGGTRNLHFSVSLGLEEAVMEYDWYYRDFFTRHNGSLHIKAHSNSAQLLGTITLEKDGKCNAKLVSAVLSELSGYDVTITPKTMVFNIVSKITQLINNAFGSRFFLPRLNKELENILLYPRVIEDFNTTVCNAFPVHYKII